MSDNYASVRSLPFPALASALGIDMARFKRRKEDWQGYCPVHNSKSNNNCFAYNDNGAFHCFSCEAKGKGALDLTKAVKACGFKEAVAFLEPFVGQQVQTPAPTEKAPLGGSGDATDGILKPFVGKYHLHQAECDWLNKRCPDKAVRDRYGVFFYQNNARKSNVNGHVLIPIRDIDGVLYGYLARNIGEVTQERPKYRLPANLPKSRFLFGASQIKAAQPLPLKVVYVVESWLSVLHFASLGLPALSPFGWSVSPEQLELLAQLAKGIVYLPDMNKYEQGAGVAAFLAARLWLRFPPLPDGCEDPEYLTKEQILAL